MGRTLRQCRITLRRVLPQFESVKSFPACLRLDRSHSSFPYSPGRGPTLPICYFPVCVFASCLLRSRLRKTNQPRRRRVTEDDSAQQAKLTVPPLLRSPCLCASVASH